MYLKTCFRRNIINNSFKIQDNYKSLVYFKHTCSNSMLWLGELLYPEMAEYDLYEEVKTYYDLFYHCDLTRAQYQDLMAKSIGKAGAP